MNIDDLLELYANAAQETLKHLSGLELGTHSHRGGDVKLRISWYFNNTNLALQNKRVYIVIIIKRNVVDDGLILVDKIRIDKFVDKLGLYINVDSFDLNQESPCIRLIYNGQTLQRIFQ